MEFRRIDEDTVRCELTQEDMMEQGLEIEDFIRNRQKVQGFLEEIVRRAKDEVGYEAETGMISMQVMPMPENGLAITFSEKTEQTMQDMLNHIKEMVSGLGNRIQGQREGENASQDILEGFDGTDIKNDMSGLNVLEGEMTSSNKIKGKKNKKKKTKSSENGGVKIYQFNSIGDFEDFCRVVSDEKKIKSALYRQEVEHNYYLVLEKGKLSARYFQSINEIAKEYGRFISDKKGVQAYLEEHVECMIPKKAVAIMGNIARIV